MYQLSFFAGNPVALFVALFNLVNACFLVYLIRMAIGYRRLYNSLKAAL
jgi:hypothetical protein